MFVTWHCWSRECAVHRIQVWHRFSWRRASAACDRSATAVAAVVPASENPALSAGSIATNSKSFANATVLTNGLTWSVAGRRSPCAVPRTRFRPAQAIEIDPKRPIRMSVAPRHVALLIAANDSAFASPILRKKSLGGRCLAERVSLRDTNHLRPRSHLHPSKRAART